MATDKFETPANFIGFGPSGVSHYRTMLPAMELKASMFVRSAKDWSRAKIVGPQDPPVVVYSMPCNEEMIDECLQLLTLGVKLIIDIDDSLRSVVDSEHHPARHSFKPFVTKHEWLLSKADAVICSTQNLADYAKECGAKRTFVIGNGIDLDRWNIKREPRHRDFTVVGWSGGYGHEDALAEYLPAISQLLYDRPDIVFCTAGQKVGDAFNADIRHRIHDTGWFPIHQHPSILTQFHINIGPAVDSPFYRAKTPLRALEAWASDSLFIGHELVYGDVVTGGRDGMLFGSPEEMVDLIIEATDSPKLNHDMRKAGAKTLREKHLMEHRGPEWKAAINAVLEA